jgi:hypothetical protein
MSRGFGDRRLGRKVEKPVPSPAPPSTGERGRSSARAGRRCDIRAGHHTLPGRGCLIAHLPAIVDVVRTQPRGPCPRSSPASSPRRHARKRSDAGFASHRRRRSTSGGSCPQASKGGDEWRSGLLCSLRSRRYRIGPPRVGMIVFAAIRRRIRGGSDRVPRSPVRVHDPSPSRSTWQRCLWISLGWPCAGPAARRCGSARWW